MNPYLTSIAMTSKKRHGVVASICGLMALATVKVLIDYFLEGNQQQVITSVAFVFSHCWQSTTI